VEDHVEDQTDLAGSTDDDQESDEEDWQREAAAQLAKEAEEEEKRQQEENERAKEEAQKPKQNLPQLSIPDRVDLSIEEGKALFKVRLQCVVFSLPSSSQRCIYRPYSGRRT
jgi:hypothetical protein